MLLIVAVVTGTLLAIARVAYPYLFRGRALELREGMALDLARTGHKIDEAFAFNLNGRSGYIPLVYSGDTEKTHVGIINFSDELGISPNSVVLLGTEQKFGREYVVKYSTDMGNQLLTDYAFLTALNDTNISPKIYGISDEILVDTPRIHSRKVSSLIYKSNRMMRRPLRFIVEESLGHSIIKYVELRNEELGQHSAFIREVISLGIKCVELLTELHSKGIVHRDIHGGNIVFRKRKEGIRQYDPFEDSLALIDFERSVFFPDLMDKPVHSDSSEAMNPNLMSLWAHKGERSGRRDDLFNLFELLAVFLSNFLMDQRLQVYFNDVAPSIPSNEDEDLERAFALMYKSGRSYFAFDKSTGNECCQALDLTNTIRDQITKTLESAMTYIRSLSHPDVVPDYDLLLRSLRTVDSIILFS